MSEPIKKLRYDWDHNGLIPEVVDTINALIDHVEALEKRVEDLERHEHFRNNGAMFIPWRYP